MTTPSILHQLAAPIVIGDPSGARIVVAPDQRSCNMLLDLLGHPTPYDTFADDDPRWSWVVYDAAGEVHADYAYESPEEALGDGEGYFLMVHDTDAEKTAAYHPHTGY